MRRERRSPKAWRLRVYIDALKEARKMTDQEWIDNWVAHCDANSIFMPRSTWISILEFWAVEEAEKLTAKMVA